MAYNEVLAELGRRAPHIVFAALAARQGGFPALGAFQGGVFEAEQARAAQQRQAQLDDERRQQQAVQEARAQAAEQRAVEAARRAEEDQRIQRFQGGVTNLTGFGTQLAENASDPVAAENAMLGRASALESVFNIPAGHLPSFIPNMGPTINRGVRNDARELLRAAEAKAARIPGGAVNDTAASLTWNLIPPRLQNYLRQSGHRDGDPVKPSQLEAIGGAIAFAPPAPRLTYGDLFPAARNTPQGSVAAPVKDGVLDFNEASLTASRMGWVSDRTAERQVRDAAITAARERLKYEVRNKRAARTTIAELRRLGLDPQVEINNAALAVERENLNRARGAIDPLTLGAAEFEDVNELMSAYQQGLGPEEPAGASGGAAGVPEYDYVDGRLVPRGRTPAVAPRHAAPSLPSMRPVSSH